jgi:hypothetical protein
VFALATLIALTLLSTTSASSIKSLFYNIRSGAVAAKPAANKSNVASPAKMATTPTAKRTRALSNPILGTATMNVERHSHAAARLGDGKVLIVGGENSRGQVRESEIFDPATRRFATAANLDTARTEHTATALGDGRVLIAGGRHGAQPLRSTEIYDYNANGFSAGPQLNRPRAGHTATLLPGGRILIAGGSADGSAEVFDPLTQTSTLTVGRMIAARSFHSAIGLASGKVLIVGGAANGGAALISAEIYDPATQRFTATSRPMRGARVKPALNRLPDGKVQVIGGDSDGTMEMFNAGGGYFTAYAHIASNPALLATPGRAAIIRRGRARSAIANEDAAQTAAATLAAAADDPLDRGDYSSTDTGSETLVAGGEDSNNTTLNSAVVTSNSPATVTTDQTDYHPGETVTITGSGWLAGETVQLTLQRDNGAANTVLTAVADADGNFTNSEYVCQDTDADVSFILTAVGQTSGYVAETTFTDAANVGSISVGTQSPNPVCSGSSATYTVTVNRNGTGGGPFTTTLSIASLPAGASGSFSPNPVSFGGSDNSKTATLTVTTTAGTTPGGATSFTVSASGSSATATGTLTVSATPSVTTPPSSATKTVGDSQTFSVTATGTAPLTYQWRKGGVNIGGATSSSYTISPVSVNDAGNYDVVVTNSCGSATSTPLAVLTVNKKTLTVTGVTANNKVYDGNTTATLNTGSAALSGLVAGLSSVTLNTGGATGTFADKNVGTGKTVTVAGLTISGADAANYNLTQPTGITANITALVVTGSITANNKVYDATNAATIATRSLSGVIAPDVVSYTGGTATFSDKNVGTGKTVTTTGLSLSGADAGNYTVNTTATTTADITALAITGSITAASKTYDGTATATILTRTLSGVLGGDVVSYSGGTATFSDKNVGVGKTVTATGLSLSGADAGNYTVNTTATTTADITARALTVGAMGVNKVYDGTTAATVTLSDNRVAGDVLTVSYTTATFADKNAGIGKTVSVSGISISGTDAGNYTVNTSTTTTANITALAITGSITAASKIYDGNTTATILTRTLSGVIGGDDVSYTGGTASFANKNVGTGKTVTATGLALSGADAGNYTVNSTAATTADITALAITGSITASSKVYDGNTTATILTRSLSGVITPDVVSYTGGTATFSDKSVGTGKTVTATGLGLSGADAGNYTVNTTATTTADITARALTVTATGVNKVYDGTTAASVSLSDNRVSGDVLTVNYTSASFADKNVGVGKTVTVSGISISGIDAGNYTANTTALATADITARALAVTATASNKVYDGTTAASVTLSDNRVSGDSLTVSYTGASFSDKNVGVGKTVTVSGISISGSDAGNYTVNTSTTTTANITALAITGSITANNKVYDGTTAATIASRTLSGAIGGDAVTYTGGTATFDNKNVGVGKTVTGTGLGLIGSDAGNYTVNTTAVTTADITARALTVTATGVNKVYDGTTAATVTLADNRVAGDVLTASYTTASFADKNVGTGKTVSVSGISIGGPDAGNYTVNTTASTTANITAKSLTVSATGVNKVYDGTTAATVTLSDNRVSGDVLTAAYTSATFANKNVGVGKTVSVSGISISGADAGNYTANTTATTTADITALAITGNITAASKVYDGTTAATILTRTLSGVIGGDVVSYTGGTATFANKNVGTGKTVTGTGLGLSGGDAGNYTVNTTATTTANITAASLTIAAVTNTKVYDGTTSATATPTFTGLQTGDSVTGLSETYDNPNVGAGKTLSVASYTVNDGNSGNNYTVATVANTTGVITAAGTGVAVTVTPGTRQYSDVVTLTATITGATPAIQAQINLGGTVVFSINSVALVPQAPLTYSTPGGVLTATGTFVITKAPGSYTVVAAFTPVSTNITGSSGSSALAVTPEDARVYYTGMLFVNTTCATCGTATVTLSATVKDITAVTVDPAFDSNAGDISKATLTFVNRDTNTDIATVPISLVSAADPKVGTAVYNWNVNIGSADSLDYTIGFRVNGYYTRDASTDDEVVTISKPIGTNFITGGGFLVMSSSSAGQYAGIPGSKTNFGFNVKYNNSGRNLQGRVNAIVRGAGGRVYQIKGNQMDTLTVNNANPAARTAIYTGKANLTDITDPLNPISLGGGHTFQMKLTDKGEPGSADTMGITVYANNTGALLFSSNWNGTSTVEQLLGGGNLVVR